MTTHLEEQVARYHAWRDQMVSCIETVRSSDPRRLAALFVGDRSVQKVSFGADGRTLVVETHKRDDFFGRLTGAVLDGGIEVDEISSPDDNLQSVFEYLVGK